MESFWKVICGKTGKKLWCLMTVMHRKKCGVGCNVICGKTGKKLWDAGKMKKGVPGLRKKSSEARFFKYGTLGDYFFNFAVAGTRNFFPVFPREHFFL